jgi:VWFA-related protein
MKSGCLYAFITGVTKTVLYLLAMGAFVFLLPSQGKPVTDLISREFTIFDNGRAQTVAPFLPAAGEQVTPSSAVEGPSVYTNIPAGSTMGVTILLFDTLLSRLTSQAYALDRIRKFLDQIEPQDHLGIYVLGQDLEVAHDFTRDASDLVAAIQR